MGVNNVGTVLLLYEFLKKNYSNVSRTVAQVCFHNHSKSNTGCVCTGVFTDVCAVGVKQQLLHLLDVLYFVQGLCLRQTVVV